MKTLKKNFIAGIGRALGFIVVYATVAITLMALGIEIDFSTYPPSLEGEILSTIQQ